jgi:hypothetical protein
MIMEVGGMVGEPMTGLQLVFKENRAHTDPVTH